jgi:hypothetical protein
MAQAVLNIKSKPIIDKLLPRYQLLNRCFIFASRSPHDISSLSTGIRGSLFSLSLYNSKMQLF